MRKLVVKGAREHNLKNIDIDLDKNQLIVFTGVSGSGKSSLAFDTIYTEGQRRYVESLSNYTKQFLGVMKKPKVDSIDGLSPAISIEQKTSSSNPRSTVGTVTEIFDFVRMLYARVGKQYCHECGREVSSQTIDEIITAVNDSLEEGDKFLVVSPYIEKQKGNLSNVIDALKASGYHRVLIDETEYTLDDDISVDAKKFHKLYVIVDRLIHKKDDKEYRSRLTESTETALELADGNLIIRKFGKTRKEFTDKLYSEKQWCQHCKISFPDLSPNSFSFNTPAGMCPECHGLGFFKAVDMNKLVVSPEKSIKNGAIPYIAGHNIETRKIESLFKIHKVEFNTPINKIPKKLFDEMMYGSNKEVEFYYNSDKFKGTIKESYEGLMNTITRRYRETTSDMARSYYERMMSDQPCPVCKGKRLRQESLAVKVNNETIDVVSSKEISHLHNFVEALPASLNEKENFIATELIKEMLERLGFLQSVGLSYLTLDRKANTLSGGEAQRIRLASQIASGLSGVIYVLDEPSIGLHQKDNQRLLNNLLKLRDKGNTVLVVEHDRDTIETADTIVDFGPHAGIYGGEIVYHGNYKKLEKQKTHTSDYIFRRKNVVINKGTQENNGSLVLKGAKTNNLKDVSVNLPLEKISVVTGVSGAGKSSLVMDTLYEGLKKMAKNSEELNNNGFTDRFNNIESQYDEIYFTDNKGKKVDNFKPRLIKIDQSPIGRTPRSNPVTYIGAFDVIREIMAMTKLSKMRGYNKSRFSFNVKGGRCEKCGGSGVLKIEMHFLADVYVECNICKGKRYNQETLDVQYKGKNINEILNMDVQEAYEFFEAVPKLKNKLGTLMAVGLGYIKLGQASTTLSGGEAQRIKLAKELSRTRIEGTVYILDEPTTGLHFYDIQKLMDVLSELRDGKSTIVIIEHNMDVIVNADYVIDLGPEGGPSGGEIICQGSVEQLMECPKSYTGKEIKKELSQRNLLIEAQEIVNS